ncbi:hypothetical protein K7X08_025606 [Anisodus acutangulus]|uniref:Uncharacterized protein n=1 Tax=Anisodus acutangulus TaxID=402998 RepID=A0A9Q1LUC8_9SOLA|nr:hypothetical protein K7X08_025606 [Anisodus acutangulus]
MPYDHYLSVGRERVRLLYMMMTGQLINMRAIMKREMKKARVGQGHQFFFSSTLTCYLRNQEVFEEKDDAQRHAMNDSITSNMYVMHCLHLTLGSTTTTPTQIAEIYKQFPLSPHAHILCKMGQAFQELLVDDVTTPELVPQMETASDGETDVAAQESERDSDDGDTDHDRTESEDEEDNDD